MQKKRSYLRRKTRNLEEIHEARGLLEIVLLETPTSESFILLLLFVMAAIKYACL